MRGDFPRHGGDLAWAADRYRRDPADFLDFSANVNPLGPPASALEAARAALDGISRYPEPGAYSLRLDLASRLGVDPGLIMLGNGSTELIHHLARGMGPRRVLVVTPAFAEYEAAARSAGADVSCFQLSAESGFELDAELLAATASSVHVTFFCNPASPTGRLYHRRELLPVLQGCRRSGGLLVVDESFMGFCREPEIERASLVSEAGGDGLVVISTLTKLYALAGLRGPGWLAGPRGTVSRLERTAVPWRVNVAAAAAARASLADTAYIGETRRKVEEWREELVSGLEEAELFRVFPSHVNFLLLRLLDPSLDALELVDELGARGILVRPCGNFRGLDEGFVRVAVRTPGENARLLEMLEQVKKTW